MIDLRQVMAAFLTFSMFVMLGNMIKRDHIDPLLEPLQVSETGKYDDLKITNRYRRLEDDPWKLDTAPVKPCWKRPLSKGKEKQDHGYIFFSLTRGPEFHASQVANAVVIARKLGATLAIPDIRGTRVGDRRKFEEVYDVNNFITSLTGVVHVDRNPPAELWKGKLYIVRVPTKVSDEFITTRVEPVFRTRRNLRIITHFDSSTTDNERDEKLSNAYKCSAMFQSLRLQPELQEVVNSMASTLRGLSQKNHGRFIAVDLRVDMLEKTGCKKSDSERHEWCYNAEEVGNLLRRIGFDRETTIYLTQKGWNTNLDPLRNIFPNTFTKDAIIPADEKARFMDSESGENEKLIDFYMCEKGDVFVPAFGSRFYGSVAGRRIANGNAEIYVPSKNSSKSGDDVISPYVAKRSHFAYSCFC